MTSPGKISTCLECLTTMDIFAHCRVLFSKQFENGFMCSNNSFSLLLLMSFPLRFVLTNTSVLQTSRLVAPGCNYSFYNTVETVRGYLELPFFFSYFFGLHFSHINNDLVKLLVM